MDGPVVAARDVTYFYGRRQAVGVADLAVPAGEILALAGPNGAGKSSLLRLLALVEAPHAGEIFFRGQAAGGMSRAQRLAARRQVAGVLQAPLLLSGTVQDNVELALKLRGVGRGQRQAAAGLWLGRLGLARLARRPATALSGGEAQRVSLARALVARPALLVLDEPFSGLDEPTRRALSFDLRQILKEDRTTAILVTHDRTEALALADRLAVMIGGTIRQAGPVAQVFEAPADSETANFLGFENLLAGLAREASGGLLTVELPGGQMIEVAGEAVRGAPVRVMIRPEEVTLEAAATERTASSARNLLAGRIAALAPLNEVARVTIDCGFPLRALISTRSLAELHLQTGQAITARFAAVAARVFPGSG